jgi:ribosome maturation factor RimP
MKVDAADNGRRTPGDEETLADARDFQRARGADVSLTGPSSAQISA